MNDKQKQHLSRVEILRICFTCILSSLLSAIFIRHPEPRDLILCLFVAGTFLGFVELWCDLAE